MFSTDKCYSCASQLEEGEFHEHCLECGCLLTEEEFECIENMKCCNNCVAWLRENE